MNWVFVYGDEEIKKDYLDSKIMFQTAYDLTKEEWEKDFGPMETWKRKK